MLLNTSFNVAGEPIVETPDDALGCLLSTGLDGCAFEGLVVTKCAAYGSFLDLVLRLTIDRVTLDQAIAPGWGDPHRVPDTFLRVFQSFHLDCAHTGLDRPPPRASSVLRLVIQTPWGPAMHIVNAGILEILRRIDGRQTGRDLLDGLRRDFAMEVDERALAQLLAGLRRVSIVDWQASRDPGEGAADAATWPAATAAG